MVVAPTIHENQSDDNHSSDEEVQLKRPTRAKTQKDGKKKVGTQIDPTAGVVYLGRVPSGFEEKEMRIFFGQFGDITRLRLSRSKKSGNSKGFAFIEFELPEVAEIVASTMNNYRMFGKTMQSKLVHIKKNTKICQNYENLMKYYFFSKKNQNFNVLRFFKSCLFFNFMIFRKFIKLKKTLNFVLTKKTSFSCHLNSKL